VFFTPIDTSVLLITFFSSFVVIFFPKITSELLFFNYYLLVRTLLNNPLPPPCLPSSSNVYVHPPREMETSRTPMASEAQVMYTDGHDLPTPQINPPPPPAVHSQIGAQRVDYDPAQNGSFSAEPSRSEHIQNESKYDTPHPTPNISVTNDKFHSLIEQKERELHDINSYRLNTLQSLLSEKEEVALNMQSKFEKLKNDFLFNVKLIEERDRELDRYETVIRQLQEKIEEFASEIQRKDTELADRISENKTEVARGQEQDNFWKLKVKEGREEIDRLRWESEEMRRRGGEEIESMRRETQRLLRERDEDMELQRREVTATFDEVMRSREGEGRRREEDLKQNVRELEVSFIESCPI